MRFRFIPLALLFALAPAAQSHDHGRRGHDAFRGHRYCSEGPRWEARHRWERWEYRHRFEDAARYRREACEPWEREAWIRIPAPSFRVRIQLP